LWTNSYNGPGNAADYPVALAVDRNDDVVVTGYSLNAPAGLNYDYATVKYSGAGAALWTNRYEGPGAGADYAAAEAVDSSGNVFVTGSSVGTNGNVGCATIAYSSAGITLWTNFYQASANSGDEGTGVATDANGNVFVTGRSSLTGVYDFLTIAFSNTGLPLWTNRFNATGTNEDDAYAITADHSGNVLVTGRSFVSGTGFDLLTIKYSAVSLPAPIPLNFQLTGNQLVLSWSNASFSLQSATAAAGSYTNVPGATSPYTNLTTSDRLFFRLKGN
jgi:hypothetical protein